MVCPTAYVRFRPWGGHFAIFLAKGLCGKIVPLSGSSKISGKTVINIPIEQTEDGNEVVIPSMKARLQHLELIT